MSCDPMLDAYLTCALWSSHDESTPSGGYPLDSDTPTRKAFTLSDFAPESVERARHSCALFRRVADANLDSWSHAQSGHDLWLTRNGHGTGFWDRDLGTKEQREALTQLAHRFGECYAYVGDDGLIYLEGGR